MKRIETNIPGVCIVEPSIFEDDRGFFMETYHKAKFKELGIDCEFVQDNHSRSTEGVLRGLHYQLGKPQAKLVRVLQGEVYDVAVDIRVGSPTFGKWTAQILSGENRQMLFIPEGFAHGFCVLSDIAEFEYKCSDFYTPSEERGILWNDPELAIPWPLEGIKPLLSDKDKKFPTLANCPKKDLPVYEVTSNR
jgi:dTDP-4-dehydrorhamnose 3,5-epimerase